MAAGFEAFSPSEVCDFLLEQVPSLSDSVLDRTLNTW